MNKKIARARMTKDEMSTASIAIADKVMRGKYIDALTMRREENGGISFWVELWRGNDKEVLPEGVKTHWRIVDYIIDELSIILSRKYLRWRKTTLTDFVTKVGDGFVMFGFTAYNK